MACVKCLQFSMQVELIIEHTYAKCCLCALLVNLSIVV